MKQEKQFSYIVVGAGVYGLSTAYHLIKNNHSVGIFQQFQAGNQYGSSHGSVRISRGTYANPVYAILHRQAINNSWPEVENQFNQKLNTACECYIYNQNESIFKKMEEATKNDPSFVVVSPLEASLRYPSMPVIPTAQKVIVDTRATVTHAEKYIQCLRKFIKQSQNGHLFENTPIKALHDSSDKVTVQTEDGRIFIAKKVVAACGRWISKVVPEISNLVKIQTQLVTYLKLKENLIKDYQIGKFPSFMYYTKDEIYFGLSDIKHSTIKFGLHRGGDTKQKYDKEEVKKKTEKEAKRIFGDRIQGIQSTEQCYYTITKTQDFIIDWSSQKERILICSCCSGHGFKFAPLIGKICSDLLEKNQSIKQFEQNRHAFQIAFHQGVYLE